MRRLPSKLSPPLGAALLGALLTLTPGAATAAGTPVRAELVSPGSIKVDGIPKEWGGLAPLTHALRGAAGDKADIEARAGLAYDAERVYVAADVTDEKLRGGGDRVVFTLGFPGGKVHELALYPGEPGKSAAKATLDGRALGSAKVVEAPNGGGWTLEASVPWSAFPPAKTVRVGMRGALSVHDADAGGVETVLSTAGATGYASLPALPTAAEQALGAGLLREKRLGASPKHNLLADVAGDALKERVLVFDRYLVVLGPGFRGGSQYFYGDLAASASRGMVPSFELRDLTGDGKADLVIRKRVGSGERYREVMEVLSFGSGDVPRPVFRHEVGVTTPAGSVSNGVRVGAEGGKATIRVDVGTAKGFDASSYREPTETSIDPVLLPWGGIKSRTFKWSGQAFEKVAEEASAQPPSSPARPAAAAAGVALPKAPSPPSPAELQEKVYALYKKERGASGKPRFDMAVDVAGDGQKERVLLHDKEVVVFGKGFKGGTGYAYLALPNFALSRDIFDLSATDLTGDGKAEIVLRGLLMGKASKEAGGGTVAREVVIVFQVASDQLRRVFAAEVGRNFGKGRVIGAMRIVKQGRSSEIELAPGRAEGFTEATYPFAQDTEAVGGFEPLLLPWGGAKATRYRWNGSAFVR